MGWGTSWTGCIFLTMLMVSNLIWTKYQSEGYAELQEAIVGGLNEKDHFIRL